MAFVPTDGQMLEEFFAPFDPRRVCNLMLDEAERNGIRVTNLALQKLLYFAHARHLIEAKRPLVSGYFEAWQYGPVHPGAYKAFKSAGASAITFRAEREDLITGKRTPLEKLTEPVVVLSIRSIMRSYGLMNATRLVEVSHAPGAPWDAVVKQTGGIGALGLRISNELIVDKFKYHKISVGEDYKKGLLGEDSPFERL
jgi:uncharacterized phage-associated protein